MSVQIRAKSLEELLEALPLEVTIDDEQVAFAICKCNKGYACYGFWIVSGETVYVSGGGELCFSSEDPKNAIVMMIGWLKINNFI